MNTILLRLFLKAPINHFARKSLVGKPRGYIEGRSWSRQEVNSILNETWLTFDRVSSDLPDEPTWTNRLMVQLAALTFAFQEALIRSEVNREHANSLVAKITWDIVRRGAAFQFSFVKMLSRSPVIRLRAAVKGGMRFPFSPPGYQFTYVPVENGVGFDMHRCPVADYFESVGASDLCVAAWCSQDYPLAGLWGAQLERTGTLASGKDRCDFRFRMEADE